jgi:hypothetical protein
MIFFFKGSRLPRKSPKNTPPPPPSKRPPLQKTESKPKDPPPLQKDPPLDRENRSMRRTPLLEQEGPLDLAEEDRLHTALGRTTWAMRACSCASPMQQGRASFSFLVWEGPA